MKIICVSCNYPGQTLVGGASDWRGPVFSMKPDTALLRNNQAFFYPDFTTDLVAEVGLVVRIDKVGRSISEKFAPRYCGAVGVAVDLTARDLLRACRAQGLPWEAARAFDFSLPLGPRMIPTEAIADLNDIHFALRVNGEVVQRGRSGDMAHSMGRIVEAVSNAVTLKMGDLIFLGAPAPECKLAVGDRLQASLGDETLLDFEIR